MVFSDVLAMPEVNVDHLLDHVLADANVVIRIQVTPDTRSVTFRVPKALISAYSKYFAAVFGGGFAEATSGESVIREKDPWIVTTFIIWMYTHKLTCYDGTKYLESQLQGLDIKEDESSRIHLRYRKDETMSTDPVTWPWKALFELYVFGDRYDCRIFRHATMEKIQTKYF